MTVLFSQLLVPGWAQGDLIGLNDVTGEISLPCHQTDGDLFFDEDPRQIAAAKSLCAACPMAKACLEGAISRAEPCGVWGGELFVDGKIVAAKRSAGRPPKKLPELVTAERKPERKTELEEVALAS